MKYILTKASEIPKVEKFGINLEIFANIEGVGVVSVNTEVGHNQEFYNKESTFTYIILEGIGTFFLDDEPVEVSRGDMLSVPPSTRIYYKGRLWMILITTPPWRQESEVETKPHVW